ncbi:MAG: hypothetical protein Q3965_02605 [Rothia sp. (in: high G+C Gram-positive bacteria)]|nr:hypothetical protein [Rothia sp. (in: high G+C Gram-positive bacteria)]
MTSDESLSSSDLEIAQKLAEHREKHRARDRIHIEAYRKIWEERLNRVSFKDLALPEPELQKKVRELQQEYRMLYLSLGTYNERIQYMLMAEKLQEILEIVEPYLEDDRESEVRGDD